MYLQVLYVLIFASIISAEDDVVDYLDISEELGPIFSEEDTSNGTNRLSKIISLVRQERHKQARSIFKQFNYNESIQNLPNIVQEVYDGNPKNVKRILSFLWYLPECEQDIVGYKSLFKAIKENGHEKMPEILLLAGSMQDCDKDFVEIRNAVKEYTSVVLSAWALKIRSGEYTDIRNFYQKYNRSSTQYALELSLTELVNITYDKNVENLKPIIAFVWELPKCYQDAVAYKSLFHAMKENGHEKKPEIVLLAGSSQKCDKYFGDEWNEVQTHINHVIAEWSSQIASHNYNHIVNFFVKYKHRSTGYALSLILLQLISVDFQGNVVHAKATLSFLQELQPLLK